MIISHVILKNWRNFRKVDVNIGRRMFIVGPNASGKSNFLDAFRFLRDIVKPGGGLQESVSNRGGISKIRCLAARQEPQIELEVHLSENSDSEKPKWKYAVGIKQESRGYRQPYLMFEKVWKGSELILDRPDEQDLKDYLRRTQTHLEQISANIEFREIANFLESISYLHLVPQLLRHPQDYKAAKSKEDPFGMSFLDKIAQTTEKTRKSRLKKIEEALQLAVPQLKQLTDIRDERGIPHLEAVYDHWRPKAGKQSEEEFSDGTLRLIGLLWSLLEGDSLLLLEEPELSLHAAIIQKLPSIIWRIQSKRKRQVLISTHSAELLSDKGIGGEDVLLLTPDREGTKVENVGSNNEIKDLLDGGLSIADIVIPRTEPKEIGQLDFFND
jgi:predicted ATPase